MGPSPNGEHIRSEQLSVKSKPAKKFAFRLGVGLPEFVGDKSGMSTEELSIVGREVPSIVSVQEMESVCSGTRVTVWMMSQSSKYCASWVGVLMVVTERIHL